jgi:hypothetical protein
MKNILKLGMVSTLLLLSTPAIAREGHNRPYGRDYGYGQHNNYDRHYKPHRRHNDGVVYGILGGFILGTIISESRETRETTTVYEEQEYYCEETKILKNHRVVKRTRCYPVD